MLRLSNESYRNHRVAAAPGTHQAIADQVGARVAKDARILDLGAYTGALIARLRDNGYSNLYAADLANHLTEPVADHWACDFNGDFASVIGDNEFDCIIACEVIEHLDNPRAFLRQCRQLLRDGGILIISTPNIEFFEGRIKFLLTGDLWGFGEKNYRSQRHITPIAASQVPLMLSECAFSAMEISTAASFATPLRRVLTAPLWLPMRAAFGRSTMGETLIVVGQAQAQKSGKEAPGQNAWQGLAA